MKKRILSTIIPAALALSLVACGNTEASTDNGTATTETDVNTTVEDSSDEESTGELTDEEKAAKYTAYTDSLKKLDGTSFKMSTIYSEENGFDTIIDGESGALFWEYPLNADCLITADYDSSTNSLCFNSHTINSQGEVETISTVALDNFIAFTDECKILFSGLGLTTEREAIMVESRGLAYTYADGVDYNITLLEIGADGTLDVIYEDGLAGSGDEDITADIRKSFNEALGSNYSKGEFEDAFYYGNLIIEQENKPVFATITFKSDTGKLADNNDWDSVNEITSKLYEQMSNQADPPNWGEGQFKTE